MLKKCRKNCEGQRDDGQVPVHYRPSSRCHGALEGHAQDTRSAADKSPGDGQGDGSDEGGIGSHGRSRRSRSGRKIGTEEGLFRVL